MNNHPIFSNLIYSIVFLLITSSCASLRPDTDPLLDKKAFLLSTQARSMNQHIITSKGTGWIRLETKKKMDRFKIAWAVVSPHKIRLTFLLSGLPIETLVANGKEITFFSHTGDHSTYTHHSKNPDMKDYILVPVKLSEIISVLLGRLPIKPFNDAWFSPSDTSLSTIILTQNRKGGTQSVQFNINGEINRLKTTTASGKLLYEMTLLNYKAFDSVSIPVKMEIKNRDNRKLTIEITNFLPNIAIKDSVFQLTESR